MAASVEGAPELDAVVVDAPEVAQTEDLEAAAVRQDRALEAHEAVQPSEACDERRPRPHREMKGVREDHLGAELAELPRRHRLDGPVGPDRHEGGGLDGSVCGPEASPPRARPRIGRQDLEADSGGRALHDAALTDPRALARNGFLLLGG